MTLDQYLNDVKTNGGEARAAAQFLDAATLRLREPEGALAPDLYSEYLYMDSRKQPTQAFGALETQVSQWRIGVRDQTKYGLSTNVYFLSQHTMLGGLTANPMILYQDYNESSAGIELTQNLWRNFLGEATRAELKAKMAAAREERLKHIWSLKNVMLRAENTYWSVVTYNQIVKLQEENVARAKRLRDWMRERAGLRLVDDVDALQAEASFTSRELELQNSLDERAVFLREFHTLRGQDSDASVELVELPPSDGMLKSVELTAKKMRREDFAMAMEKALQAEDFARASRSKLRPQLDLVAGISTNGLDARSSESFSEIRGAEHPTWNVGFRFSMALDFGILRDLKRGYVRAASAAVEQRQAVLFQEQRAWDDLTKKRREMQGRFERSLALERLQMDLVKKEQLRLRNGRTTTFQAINFEQNLALAQIQRVRAQLGLLQLHNTLKQFEEAL